MAATEDQSDKDAALPELDSKIFDSIREKQHRDNMITESNKDDRISSYDELEPIFQEVSPPVKNPIKSSDSNNFDREFQSDFDEMFSSVKENETPTRRSIRKANQERAESPLEKITRKSLREKENRNKSESNDYTPIAISGPIPEQHDKSGTPEAALPKLMANREIPSPLKESSRKLPKRRDLREKRELEENTLFSSPTREVSPRQIGRREEPVENTQLPPVEEYSFDFTDDDIESNNYPSFGESEKPLPESNTEEIALPSVVDDEDEEPFIANFNKPLKNAANSVDHVEDVDERLPEFEEEEIKLLIDSPLEEQSNYTTSDTEDELLPEFYEDTKSEEIKLDLPNLLVDDTLDLGEDDDLLYTNNSSSLEKPLEDDSYDEDGGFEEYSNDNLEEINFDDEDDELEEIALDEDDFDEFAKMALGIEDEDDEQDELDDDFEVEELSSDANVSHNDPFSDLASPMTSQEVSDFKPAVEDDVLKFEEEEKIEENPNPFEDDEETSSFSIANDDFDPLSEIEEDSEETKEETEATKESKDKKSKPKTKKKAQPNKLLKILLLPWRIYSKFANFIFSIITGLLGFLAAIPLIGKVFGLAKRLIEAIPSSLRNLIVLAFIASFIWGGSNMLAQITPKPSSEIVLPDSGKILFSEVQLKDSEITGILENVGEVGAYVNPEVTIYERKILAPTTWFDPTNIGVCRGEIVNVPIGEKIEISFNCDVEVSGIAELRPKLSE